MRQLDVEEDSETDLFVVYDLIINGGGLICSHCAKRITPNSLEFIMGLFDQLGCRESYWEDGARWAMIEQKESDIIIQFIETDQPPQTTEDKRNSHIAFLSEDPQKIVNLIKEWICKQNIKINVGKWSEKELYFDCPEIFIDFVIEIMHKSIVE